MKDGKRAGVSLMAAEIAEEIKSIDGFCTKKFKADYMTEGLDYGTLRPGDILELDGKKICITRVGKACFKDCPVPEDRKPCVLNRNVAFGEYAEED